MWVTGTTGSLDFPIVDGFDEAIGGDLDAFIAGIDPSHPAVTWSSYLGGGANDGGNAIAVGIRGDVYVAGFTASANFPVGEGFDDSVGGFGDARDAGRVVDLGREGIAVAPVSHHPLRTVCAANDGRATIGGYLGSPEPGRDLDRYGLTSGGRSRRNALRGDAETGLSSAAARSSEAWSAARSASPRSSPSSTGAHSGGIFDRARGADRRKPAGCRHFAGRAMCGVLLLWTYQNLPRAPAARMERA